MSVQSEQLSKFIYEIPPEKKYWVIKADHKRYLKHFRQHSLIAIGHLDNLSIPECRSSYKPDMVSLKNVLGEHHARNNRSKGYTTNHFNQVRNFISGVKIGDWIITKGDTSILIGRVIGHPQMTKG